MSGSEQKYMVLLTKQQMFVALAALLYFATNDNEQEVGSVVKVLSEKLAELDLQRVMGLPPYTATYLIEKESPR